MNQSPSNNSSSKQAARELMRLENVDVGYGRHTVVRDVNFTLLSDDYVAIVGSNGSGKTTLLRSVVGNLRPVKGRISTPQPLHYGYVPQLQTVDEIFPLTVLEIVLMGRYGRIGALRRPDRSDRDRAVAALAEVGIENLNGQLYRELSGGQKQRTLIARALVSDPDVLVLDEHTNDLDIAAEKAIMALIDRLHDEHRIAVLMVSHSLNTVANHAKKIGLISNGACRFMDVEDVMQSAYLEKLYNMPFQVIEVNGSKIVV